MTTTTEAPPATSVLSDDLLERFRSRAAGYDKENRFFLEDFEELHDAGYLKIAVPPELGGLGLNVAEVGREQRRLASYAPADAVAVNMHLYWTGLCADLYRLGDTSMQWLLEDAAAGEVFGAGHSERGNDLPGLYSTTTATRAEGGWKFNGHKNFGTMTPVWTRLGFHGMDSSDPSAKQVVHAFLARDDGGFRIEETWDALGMRATRSDDTILEDAFVPDARVARVLPAGGAGMDLFLLGMFGWGLTGFSNVYFAIGQRMLELTLDYVQQKKSISIASEAYAHHPETQHNIAEMVMLRDATEPLIDSVAGRYRDAILDASNWDEATAPSLASALLGLKQTVTKNALKMADLAVETVGGLGVARGGEIERLFRDARMGPIHPGNPALAHELIAKLALGIDLDQQPRWG